MSLWCLDHLFSYQIDMIMPHLHYSENGVITSCNPTIKRAENKLISAVNADANHRTSVDVSRILRRCQTLTR